MHHLFIDESGELGQKQASSEFFLITALWTENRKALEKRTWRELAKLVTAGWPSGLEIKGTSIWGSPHIPSVPKSISVRREEILTEIVTAICAGPNKVHYAIAKKKHLPSCLNKAHYGISYNYLCGSVLCHAYPKHFAGDLEIVIDARTKEMETKNKFDGYLETRLVGHEAHEHALSITHGESHKFRGLQAVDFLSWSLFRKFEHGDSRFADLITANLAHCDDWNSTKK
jgi:hypothetical protein